MREGLPFRRLKSTGILEYATLGGKTFVAAHGRSFWFVIVELVASIIVPPFLSLCPFMTIEGGTKVMFEPIFTTSQ